jgi:peptidoglycan hydrolase CwlO-like protein
MLSIVKLLISKINLKKILIAIIIFQIFFIILSINEIQKQEKQIKFLKFQLHTCQQNLEECKLELLNIKEEIENIGSTCKEINDIEDKLLEKIEEIEDL